MVLNVALNRERDRDNRNAGTVVGSTSNGLYDWRVVSNFINKFYNIFGHKKE